MDTESMLLACLIRVFGGTSIRMTLFRFLSRVFSADRSAASGGMVAHWGHLGDRH